MILDDEGFEISEKPHYTYKWFLVSAILFGFISFYRYYFCGNSAFDIQNHDTYYVIPIFHPPLISGVIMLFFAIIYFLINYLFKKPLKRILSIIHFLLTLIPLLAILLLLFKLDTSRYMNVISFSRNRSLNIIILSFLGLFILGQVIFLFNFFRSFFISLYSR